jgi:hypothetical protein
MYCYTMENSYATIKLQVLPNFLTSASKRNKVPHSIFEIRLLQLQTHLDRHCVLFVTIVLLFLKYFTVPSYTAQSLVSFLPI